MAVQGRGRGLHACVRSRARTKAALSSPGVHCKGCELQQETLNSTTRCCCTVVSAVTSEGGAVHMHGSLVWVHNKSLWPVPVATAQAEGAMRGQLVQRVDGGSRPAGLFGPSRPKQDRDARAARGCCGNRHSSSPSAPQITAGPAGAPPRRLGRAPARGARPASLQKACLSLLKEWRRPMRGVAAAEARAGALRACVCVRARGRARARVCVCVLWAPCFGRGWRFRVSW